MLRPTLCQRKFKEVQCDQNPDLFALGSPMKCPTLFNLYENHS